MTPVEKSHSDGLNGALAAILRAERAAQRLSIAYLVAHMGISKSTVLRLLAGDRAIDVAHLAGFAEAFGMDPAELMRIAEQRVAPIATVTPIRKHVTVDDLRGLARVAVHGAGLVSKRVRSESSHPLYFPHASRV